MLPCSGSVAFVRHQTACCLCSRIESIWLQAEYLDSCSASPDRNKSESIDAFSIDDRRNAVYCLFTAVSVTVTVTATSPLSAEPSYKIQCVRNAISETIKAI